MPVHIEPIPGTAFLSFPDMQNMLAAELAGRFGYGEVVPAPTIAGTAFSAKKAAWYGDLLYCPDYDAAAGRDDTLSADAAGISRENTDSGSLGAAEPADTFVPYWARTALLKPFILHFDTIGEAAKALKDIQRNWAPYQYQCFRRAELIQEKLPYINLKVRTFPYDIPHSPMGLYTLLDEKTIIASAQTSNAVPAGRIEFAEDHENPPSRAYLKIQESLTLARHYFGVELPHSGSHCFEAGACPGGWTWVLAGLGADVFAVDRAELAPELMSNPLIRFEAHDAFTYKPEEIGPFDWVFSDVICYPERLFEWVNQWLSSGLVHNMICTIKMQGDVDWPLVAKFAAIPGSRVVHLNYNKHELTWIHCGN